jgi:hypothetical protein
MPHLATVVPIVRETERSAWMKHASVVLVLPTVATLTGEVEPRSEETEPAPVRIRWVRQSARSPTGGGSRGTRLRQPSPPSKLAEVLSLSPYRGPSLDHRTGGGCREGEGS